MKVSFVIFTVAAITVLAQAEPCKNDYHQIDQSCYRVYKQANVTKDAAQICRDAGATLVGFETERELKAIGDYLDKNNITFHFRIGATRLTERDSWTWTLTKCNLPVSDFILDQLIGKGTHILAMRTKGKWRFQTAWWKVKYPFMCEAIQRNCDRVDGGASQWLEWSTCSVTCGVGTRTRNLSCTNPEPQNGGADCSQSLVGTQVCGSVDCPRCSQGFVRRGNWCYKMNIEKMNWEKAQNFCNNVGGFLALPKTDEENTYLQQMARDNGGEDVWLGSNDINQEDVWKWEPSGKLFNDNKNWAPKEPNNAGHHQNCLQLWSKKGLKWDDDYCRKRKKSICQKSLDVPHILS